MNNTNFLYEYYKKLVIDAIELRNLRKKHFPEELISEPLILKIGSRSISSTLLIQELAQPEDVIIVGVYRLYKWCWKVCDNKIKIIYPGSIDHIRGIKMKTVWVDSSVSLEEFSSIYPYLHSAEDIIIL